MRAQSRNHGGTRTWGDQRGAAVVEFAIASVLFLGLLYGIVTFGVIFMVKNTVTHAAEAGARAAIAGVDLEDQREKAFNRAQGVVSGLPASFEAHIEYPPDGSDADSYPDFPVGECPNDSQATCITVTVSYPYSAHPILPALPLFEAGLPDDIESTSVVQLTN